MPNLLDDSHLAPPPGEVEVTTGPPGFRTLFKISSSLGRFTRLAEKQGTRLVDTFEAYVETMKASNKIAERHTRAMERLADSLGGKEDEDAEPS